MRFYVLFVLMACTPTHEVRVMPDASPDAIPDAAPVVDGRDCCSLWPDVEAISACANLPAHACGRLHCETSDGPHDIPVCGPG